MDYTRQYSTIAKLSALESSSSTEVEDDDQRLKIIKHLADSPIVAFVARSVILKSINRERNQPKNNAKKRQRLESKSCTDDWISLGFNWALSDAASGEGLFEWITVCIQILKHQRSEAHPERASGAEAAPNEIDGVDAQRASYVAALCVRYTLRCLPNLWGKYNSLLSNSEATDECDRLLQAILSLVLGCVKQLLQNDVQLELHSTDSDTSDSTPKGCISIFSECGEWPSIACLHLPSLQYLCVDPAVSFEAKLRAMELLRKILQKPNALVKPIDCCMQLLIVLDDAAAAALDHIELRNATLRSNSAQCNFIDDQESQTQVAQRVLLLWSKALRSTVVAADVSGSLASTVQGTHGWRAFGSRGFGRKGAAHLIVEGLVDDDQWLTEALLDITFAAQTLSSHPSSGTVERAHTLHDSAYNLFLSGPDAPLHPFTIFAEFCHALDFDERVILDLLISSETKALEYLLRVLRLKKGTPLGCSMGMIDESKEGKALALLVRLREAATRANAHGMFPYNPRALLTRFEHFFT